MRMWARGWWDPNKVIKYHVKNRGKNNSYIKNVKNLIKKKLRKKRKNQKTAQKQQGSRRVLSLLGTFRHSKSGKIHLRTFLLLFVCFKKKKMNESSQKLNKPSNPTKNIWAKRTQIQACPSRIFFWGKWFINQISLNHIIHLFEQATKSCWFLAKMSKFPLV